MAKSSFFSGTGTNSTDVDSITSSKAAAETAATNAATSETNAASSASSASTSASNASTSASNASNSATAAATSETNAASSASAASVSQTSASNSATAASNSATNAATSEANAASSATSAASSATSASTDAAAAATSLSNIGAAETNAANSATAAATSQTAAATSATNAATSETNAATSATTASTAATNAATSETNAATSETNAATSATNAATSETNAATSATSASTSASNAATSASAASASQVSAAASAASAANSYDLFDDRYLGTKTSDPTVDNDGNALVAGALYFNSTANEMRVYDGANWIAASSAGGASLLEYKYTATSGQTTFSGADDNANSLSYTQDNLIVTLNGVVLENGTDYTATTGTSVVLASGAATSDELNVIAFKTFTTADMVAASTGGTFYGDVEVQGTLTSDGLTVDGNVGIGTSSPSNYHTGTNLTLFGSGDSGVTIASGISNASRIHFADGTSGDAQYRGYVVYAHASDSLQIATSGSEAMRIDSSGNVGIGTSSPSEKLHVEGNARLADAGSIQFGSSKYQTLTGQAGSNDLLYRTYANHIFKTTTGPSDNSDGTERMRIDSSGNLLVGTTSSTPHTGTSTGVAIRNDGGVFFTRANADVLNVNRTTSDGAIAQFRKDGTTVGSIGTNGSDLYIGSTDSLHGGVTFAQRAMLPNLNGVTPNDGGTDLGGSSNRWRDAYLSGGVYLGGTGSANKLDDYEEGTHNITLNQGGVGLNTSYHAWRYTKIGRMVYIEGLFLASSSGDTNIVKINLPFTYLSRSGNTADQIIQTVGSYDVPTGSGGLKGSIVNNTSLLEFRKTVDNGAWTSLVGTEMASGDHIYVNLAYPTT